VGYDNVSSTEARALTARWGGHAWRVVEAPSPSSDTLLTDVLALGPGDVWAVGEYQTPDFTWHTLAEHWDGLAWSQVPTPDAAQGISGLKAVGGAAPNDLWAVGNPTLHWDGVQWQVATMADASAVLYDVAALATDDVWAVGAEVTGTHAEHWDGSAWTVIPTPDRTAYSNSFMSVAVRSSGDVSAVGNTFFNEHQIATLVEHWDGAAWSIVPSQNPSNINRLEAVAAVGANDAWAVGSIGATADSMTEHWDGTGWHSFPIPRPPGHRSAMFDVTAIPGGGLWAVNINTIFHHC
jgi:hypothetical protein